MRRLLLAFALLPALILAACGSAGTIVGGGNRIPPSGTHAAAFDPRDGALGCIVSKGIQAQKDPRQRDKLVILPASKGAFVQFASTPAEAQGRQLANEAPGAEVIGPRLLTVGTLSDAELGKIEACLQAQGSKY